MQYCTPQEVIQFTQSKPKHFNLANEAELENLIGTWIKQATDLIDNYINTSFKEENVPLSVSNVCLRLTSNMVALAIARRDTPVTEVKDWNVSIISSRIFTNDLKNDLEPFVVEETKNKSKIDILTISGDDLW